MFLAIIVRLEARLVAKARYVVALCILGWLLVASASTAAATAAAAAAAAFAVSAIAVLPILGRGLAGLVRTVLVLGLNLGLVRLGLDVLVFILEGRVHAHRSGHHLARRDVAFSRTLDQRLRTLQVVARRDEHRDAIGGLDGEQVVALLVENVEGDLAGAANREVLGLARDEVLLDRPQHGKAAGRDRADDAAALAMRAGARGSFEKARAQPLARHFEQAEVADVANLDARAVVLQRILQAALDVPVVALLLHVDEVDHDQAGQVTQTQLAGDLVGGLEVGLVGRVLDVVFARRLAGVDVDSDQRFGLVDHHVAARRQRDGG